MKLEITDFDINNADSMLELAKQLSLAHSQHEPLDGDETQSIAGKILFTLDWDNGNLDDDEIRDGCHKFFTDY